MHEELLDLSKPLVWTIRDVLSPSECRAMIARIEEAGCAAAPIMTGQGLAMVHEIRNNTVATFEDPVVGGTLFKRIQSGVPETLQGMRAVSVNARLRCYKYEPGQRFAPHHDGAVVHDDHERSLLTLMVYLNEGFEGGTTRFLGLDQSITPKLGMALLFQHALLHEGCVVESGVKYVLRSDVMYHGHSRVSRAASPLTARSK